ncbi:hypothetical protein D5086_000364 [Populus alba]|uniref:Uncharacterized protein n=1 Tax=Populus alba TaxID=43335 RepID=A0ACC4CW59_POPAL
MPKDTTTSFWKHCSSSPTLARMKSVQQGNLLQQIRSWTISLAHDLVHGFHKSPANGGLVEGKLLYKRGVNGTVGVCGFGGGFELGIGLSRSVILDMQPSLMHGLSSLLHGDSVSSWPFVESGLGGELKVS